MKDIYKKLPYTLLGLGLALVLFALAATFKWEVFEAFVTLVHKGEAYEVDEIILPMVFVLLGLAADATISALKQRSQQDQLDLYNQMSTEMVNEISDHLTKLLQFRLSLIENAPQHYSIHRELDSMIVQSFKHFEHAQRRTEIDMSLLSLVTPAKQPVTGSPEGNEPVAPAA